MPTMAIGAVLDLLDDWVPHETCLPVLRPVLGVNLNQKIRPCQQGGHEWVKIAQ